jgi:predicted P-loop ATPase
MTIKEKCPGTEGTARGARDLASDTPRDNPSGRPEPVQNGGGANYCGTLSVEDAEAAFSAAMADKGYGEHDIPADGKWHSFDAPGDSGKKKSAKLTVNGHSAEGVVKDFRKGRSPIFTWRPGMRVEVNDEHRARIEEEAAEDKAKRDRVRTKSLNLFATLPEASANHPYLVRKKITNPYPLKLDGDKLVVPIYNAVTGEFQAIQRIWPDGKKLSPKGATMAGGCAMPGSLGLNKLDRIHPRSDEPIVIAEGFATAYSIHSATLYPTLAAMTCGNLKAVAKAIRDRDPLRKIIIAADDETKKKEGRTTHPGINDARKAARAIGYNCFVAYPSRGDFNDVFVEDGEQRVKEQIDAAEEPPASDTSETGLELGDNGRPRGKSQRNIRRAMELIGVAVHYDSFHDRMLITGLDGYDVVDDATIDKLWLTIDERLGFLPDREFFYIVVAEAARRNTFHPVKDYLDGLEWDGVPRLDKWLITYGGAEDTSYTRAVGSITLIAAVRRIRQPGCKFDEMLILESPQGKSKSEMLAVLACRQGWFSDDLPLNADAKKVIEQTQGKWIMEAADMSGYRKTDVDRLKSMLSRQVDGSRMAYGRLPVERPRQFIIIGTTNDKDYLKDITGNRRFWPIATPLFDVAMIKKDRDQLWAEAAAREAKGESIRLDPKLWDAAAAEQAERTAADPWHDLLEDVLGDITGKILSADVWHILDVPTAQRTQDKNKNMGSAMRALGFKRTLLKFDGKNKRCYARGSDEERAKRIYISREGHFVVAGHSEKEAMEAATEIAKKSLENRPM